MVAQLRFRSRWLARAVIVALLTVLITPVAQNTAPPAAQAVPGVDDIVCAFAVLPGTNEKCHEVADTVSHPIDALSELASSSMGKFVKSLLEGTVEMFLWSMSWWVKLPSPNLTNFSALQAAKDYTFQLQLVLLTASVMLTGARLAFTRKAAIVAETESTFRSFSNVVFSSYLYAAVIVLVTRIGDAWSSWVIDDVTGKSAEQAVKNLLDIGALSVWGIGPLFLISIVGFIGAFLQVILLVVRQAFLVVVAAMIPIAGSAVASGSVGKQSYERLISWSIAFCLFKPVGALVYLIAFTAFGSVPQGSDLEKAQQVILGLVLLTLVAAVLPTLMRVVTPAVASMGSGGSGLAGVMAASAAIAQVAGMAAGGAGMASGGAGAAGAAGAGGARSASGGGLAGNAPAGADGGGARSMGNSDKGGSSTSSTKPPSDAKAPSTRSNDATAQGSGSGSHTPSSSGGGGDLISGAGSAVMNAASAESAAPHRHSGEIPQ